jgi:hypothetical protein
MNCIDPQVQMHGDVGILTFNFIGFMKDGSKEYFNTTEVYKLIEKRLEANKLSLVTN